MSEKRVRIRSAEKMKEMMTLYYMTAKMAEQEKSPKIAWITSGGPVEILHAAGVIPIYPENHAAMCGTVRMADRLCGVAEDRGYSRDLCSYARSDIGSILSGESPIGGSPKPDFLVCCNNICGTVTKWYQALQRMFNVPLIFIDAPYQYEADRPEALAYMKAQLEEMIQTVGEITGKPIKPDTLTETLLRSEEAVQLWRDIQDLLRHRPAPMNSFDTFIHLAPIVTLRGTPECIDYYKELKAEMEERVRDGVAAVPGEQFRLGWDNLAIWYKVKFLADKFAEHHAALVVSTYTENFCYQAPDRREDDLLWTMAANYLGGYINHGLDYRERELTEMAENFHLDGFVMHSNRSCRAYSFGQYELAQSLERKRGIPTLMIEADQSDTRAWSDEQVATRIDAFMESLAARRVAV
ncbi:MAG TPA: 2-hydroxyacyl-CoA dehydratase family protein [Candidatus Hydrogenedentes bacterium]|nr:2-hydroxyacyl-CoA dehydratase family protein [Candidatus Hydrogenedentota bacterium]